MYTVQSNYRILLPHIVEPQASRRILATLQLIYYKIALTSRLPASYI